MCIFQVNFPFSDVTELFLLFQRIYFLLICINVGFVYFLKLNIFVSFLVEFIVRFYRYNSSRDYCIFFIRNSQIQFHIISISLAKMASQQHNGIGRSYQLFLRQSQEGSLILFFQWYLGKIRYYSYLENDEYLQYVI